MKRVYEHPAPEVCEEHRVPLEWYDDGDGETGPSPHQECPKCRDDRNHMECEVCGRHSKIIQRRTISVLFDPTEVLVLDCGHVVM